MKRLFTSVMVLLLALTLVACKKPKKLGNTYRVAFGEAKNLNSLTTIQASDSDVYEYLLGSFYETDYDWPTAIEKGIASEVGDFSKIYADVSLKSDEKPYSIDDLGYNRILSDAAKFPYAVNAEDDATNADGTLDMEASKTLIDNKWRITLRDDLVFSNGTKIDTSVVEYSIKQYLSPTLLAERGNHIYDSDYLNLRNAREYYYQLTPDEDGEMPEEVAWEDVGFKVIDDLTFEITMNSRDTQWGVMGSLGVFNLVEPELFESGYNSDKTTTTYGSLDNIPPSYGPYVLESWEQDQKFSFVRNETYHNKDRYAIEKIDGPIIADQSARIDEFKAGNLDVAGVSGVYYPDFVDNPGLYITPSNQFMRLDFSIDRTRGGKQSGDHESLILKEDDFRQALMVGIDRNAFVQGPVAPAEPLVGYVSNIHRTHEDDPMFYNDTPQHLDLVEELGLDEDGGYNPVLAKELFDKAYDNLVEKGEINDGDKVSVEYAYYDVESNVNIAVWLKGHFEDLFGNDKFEWKNKGRGQDDHRDHIDAGDFDIAFAGLSGGNYMTVILFDMVYGADDFYSGQGFDIRGTELTAEVPNMHEILSALDPFDEEHEEVEYVYEEEPEDADEDWEPKLIDIIVPEGMRTPAEQEFIDSMDENGVFEGTFLELSNLYQSIDRFNADYDGRDDDLRNIVQALEGVMFELIPSVPLFSSIGATVYSDRVNIGAPAWNERMGWGGLRYMTISND